VLDMLPGLICAVRPLGLVTNRLTVSLKWDTGLIVMVEAPTDPTPTLIKEGEAIREKSG